MLVKTDEAVKAICFAAIKRGIKTWNEWKFTHVIEEKQSLKSFGFNTEFHKMELPVLATYITPESNSLLTTRRLMGIYQGNVVNIKLIEVVNCDFGWFKNYGQNFTDEMRLTIQSGDCIGLEYETGSAAIAVMHSIQYLRKDHFGQEN